MNKCIFLDRDGVINVERGEYTYKIDDFEPVEGVVGWLKKIKSKGFLLIVVTNQGGINKGIYKASDVLNCHHYFQKLCGEIIDDIFYCPYHDDYTNSLSRKPDSLMLERAIYKWDIDVSQSWMVGDSLRDLQCASKVDCKSVYIGNTQHKEAEQCFESSANALKFIYNL